MASPPMICPESGLWRAWLDGEKPDDAGTPVPSTDHLTMCPDCRATVQHLRRDAAEVSAALDRLAPDALPSTLEVELARARLDARAPARLPAAAQAARSEAASGSKQESYPMPFSLPLRRWRTALAGLAAALALTFLLGTSNGQDALAAFLAQFRGQRLAIVTIDPTQSRHPTFALERLGTVQGAARGRPVEEVKTIAEASQKAGFTVKQPDPATLPSGVNPTPRITFKPAHEARITFDRDRARSYFESVGRPELRLPDRLHGVTLVVSMPQVVLLEYTGAARDRGLAVGQVGELTAGVEGNATLDEVREFLLGLPGLPQDTVRQLRAMQDWRTTVPIPVPVDKVSWQPATIAGGPGYVLNEIGGLGNAAIWQRDGRVYGVAGTASAAEILRVANGLR